MSYSFIGHVSDARQTRSVTCMQAAGAHLRHKTADGWGVGGQQLVWQHGQPRLKAGGLLS